MEPTFKKIDETEFDQLEVTSLFYDAKTSRCFGTIYYGTAGYKFAWQSTDIAPNITKVKEGIYALGVDQDFSIIDIKNKSILLSINLDFYFFDTKILNDCILLITELEIIKLHSLTFHPIQTYGLPDIFESILFENDNVRINCVGGQVVLLE